MARFGLDAETLLAEHPGLVVASSSANGSTGPDAGAAGLASIFAAGGGLSEQTGYPDGPPTEVGESTDRRSANALTVGIIAALLHRARTGEGQHVDLSSREVVIASAPDALLAHVLGAPWQSRVGNGHREMAPHNVYPCAGEDQWVALAVRDDDDWVALCRVLGRPEWTQTCRSATDRRQAETMIDAAISAWTAARHPDHAFAALQAAGVPAAPVMNGRSLAADPHLAARGVFVEVFHPELGVQKVMRAPWLFDGASCEIRRHGPLLGQDTEFVLDEILGLGAGSRDELAEALR
jgi:benzylsuccinate CoA-transferase BbsF subunit